METKPRRLALYRDKAGRVPFEDWLRALRDVRGRAKILARLERVEEGNLGLTRPVGEGVLELKIDFGPGYRVYLGQDGPTLVVLLCGGDKSTQRADILKAIQYWTDYQSRR